MSYVHKSVPSPLIDAAVCDLIAAITHFSDDHFDSEWIGLQEEELEQLTVKLLQRLAKTLDGGLLGYLLLEIRSEADSS